MSGATRQTHTGLTLDAILREKNVIDQHQLEEITRVRMAEGGGWAGHFVDAGIITENELLLLGITEAGVPYIPLLQLTIDPGYSSLLSWEYMQTHECVLVDTIGMCTTIVTPNPFQPSLIEHHREQGVEVVLSLCRISEWREHMRRIQEQVGNGE